MTHENYQRNHATLPGREAALHTFLNGTAIIDGVAQKHKLKNACNSNSEDALTWSCFDILRNLPLGNRLAALDEIMEDAFDGNPPFWFNGCSDVQIHIGKQYRVDDALPMPLFTEADASIETTDKLVVFEAKLYGTVNATSSSGQYDQLAHKLRVGSEWSNRNGKKFYLIWLDIAPINYIRMYGTKKVNADSFDLYKNDPSALEKVMTGISSPVPLQQLQRNMGWLTWSCLYKTVLRGMIRNGYGLH
jgi:hypothetical protein